MPSLDKIIPKLSRWRVRAGLPAALLTLIFAQPRPLSLIAGLVISLLALALRAWAAGHLNKNMVLATSGPYRFSRNPLYLANFLLGLGLATAANSLVGWLAFSIYFFCFYPCAIITEQRRLAELFPADYSAYGRQVPLFFPHWKRSWPSASGRFRLALYFKNKEYRALLATVGFLLLLLLKWVWLKP